MQPQITQRVVTTDPTLTSGEWQNSSNSPTFSWDAVSGAEGYFIYFGPNPSGTSTDLITATSYQPNPVSTGTYYLNINTKDTGEDPPDTDWSTLFTLRYDDTPPGINVTESGGAISNTPQNSINTPSLQYLGD